MGDYGAPLFLAWQLTNRCTGRCRHCCEDSGPDQAWPDELSRPQALALARAVVAAGIPYVAFGGGEPMGCPWFLELLEVLAAGGVAVKIETNGLYLSEAAADRLRDLRVACVQVSVDGATAEVHESLRPGSGWAAAWAAVERLAARGLEPEVVFIPTRMNVAHAVRVYEQAAARGARTFVTGPLMRLGRAAEAWASLACRPEQWQAARRALAAAAERAGGRPRLACYPWGIQREAAVRAADPQAMMLVVPNGKVKLLNALPFAVADVRTDGLEAAWAKVRAAWAAREVQDFVRRIATEPGLLRHANECWQFPAPGP